MTHISQERGSKAGFTKWWIILLRTNVAKNNDTDGNSIEIIGELMDNMHLLCKPIIRYHKKEPCSLSIHTAERFSFW